MPLRSILIASLLCLIETQTAATNLNKEAFPTDKIQSLFAPYAVQTPFRNRFERAEIVSLPDGRKSLQINLWYEDSSVIRTGTPSDALFCRISHLALFGRHHARSELRSLPLDRAFEQIAQLAEVKITYFAVFFSNKPAGKPSAALAGNKDAPMPRVTWIREEKLIPYLIYSISAGEWKTLSALVKAQGQMNYQDYENKFCANALKVAGNLKANFRELQAYLAAAKSGTDVTSLPEGSGTK